MHCPLCGEKLEYVEYKPCKITEDDITYDEPPEELNIKFKIMQDYEKDKHEELWCPQNGCFGKDYPLYYHHPFENFRSIPTRAPGDSWSLSWIK